MKELGSASYFPRVYDFFPKTARGHGAMSRYEKVATPDGFKRGSRSNDVCNAVSCMSRNGRGEKHLNQEQNRADWEETVGIRRTSRTTRNATKGMMTAAHTSIDPKELKS